MIREFLLELLEEWREVLILIFSALLPLVFSFFPEGIEVFAVLPERLAFFLIFGFCKLE